MDGVKQIVPLMCVVLDVCFVCVVCAVTGDELWYYGKMSRQKCEELMIRVRCKYLAFLILTHTDARKPIQVDETATLMRVCLFKQEYDHFENRRKYVCLLSELTACRIDVVLRGFYSIVFNPIDTCNRTDWSPIRS